ncbi:MAG: DUF1697 domain-containing protein [Alphaproteobacteria bacterium]|nr:DUF1697 domain-containing protein [Alphaproteobacteria bacterium]MBU1513174.1 DUF1697 domain-containing protein [Alphaproteobacteria bacterium]MBU2095282.1 DUF1697 domain-containing protein [Alphaproteobacteria bacterium]MBU2152197.1 DUF1697 domain-containing protein [Alphaproteobacteria bacterium]MBU2306756.1 DUF1697 domain-containing protein [Alphaproteobacteria bacterium]
MKRVAGLLRAVNVGGRKLLMADLKRIAGAAGFDAPSTLLASGNVLFGTTLAPEAAEKTLEAAIQADLGLAADVMVRDLAQLTAVIAANPFPRQAKDEPSRLMAMFLTGERQGELSLLDSACVAGEEVRLGPGCLYIWFPGGAGTSKLSNVVIERRLKVRGTARNWNTVNKLAALLDA